ncbi:hypothetical protein [Lysobacter gummosus]
MDSADRSTLGNDVFVEKHRLLTGAPQVQRQAFGDRQRRLMAVILAP